MVAMEEAEAATAEVAAMTTVEVTEAAGTLGSCNSTLVDGRLFWSDSFLHSVLLNYSGYRGGGGYDDRGDRGGYRGGGYDDRGGGG